MRMEIPQVRGEVEFYASALELGTRSQRALKLALAETYAQLAETYAQAVSS
jgi:hypothetical protein